MSTASEACIKATQGRIDNGADEMRLIVRNMNRTRESFNARYTSEQLIQIFRMHLACGWDIDPDEWTPRQVREALAGTVPTWDIRQRATYAQRLSECCLAEVTDCQCTDPRCTTKPCSAPSLLCNKCHLECYEVGDQ
jgi:hypothetical protein